MIGAIISGAAGLASSVIGGIKAGKERKKASRALRDEQQFNENLFNKEYYSNPLERSDNAAMLKSLRGMLDKQTRQSAATGAVMGSTPEAVMASKEQANETLSNAAGNISAMNSRYKDNVMGRYLNQRNNLYNQKQGVTEQNAQSWTNLMQNGIGTMMGSASSMGRAVLDGASALGTPGGYIQAPSNPGVSVQRVKVPTKFGE